MQNIKLIVFDFDGTIYDLNDVYKNIYDLQVNYLANHLKIDAKKSKQILEENRIYPVIKKDSESATAVFERLGIDKNDWLRFKEENFDLASIKKENSANFTFLNSLTEKYKLYLVSTNSLENIKKISSALNFNLKIFDKIYCDGKDVCGFSKKNKFQEIAKSNNLSYSKMLSVGDRYKTDILPMIELGGQGILIQSPKEIEEKLNFLI